MSASAPSRRPLFLLAAAAIAAFVAFELGLWWLDRVWFFQWATAREGRPALSGVWVGQLATGTGRPRGVLVELRRHVPKRRPHRCDRCGSIRGRALTCDERGNERAYRLSGTPSDRRATRVEISAGPAVDPPPDGLEMNTLIGGWDGADVLTLAAGFFWRRGASAITSSDDPDTSVDPTLRMRRGTEADYRAACHRLATR